MLNRRAYRIAVALGSTFTFAGAAVAATTVSSSASQGGRDSQARALAYAAAHDSGDDSPGRIQYVMSDRGQAARVISGAVLGQDTQRSVYVIEISGSFVAKHAHTLNGIFPSGDVLTVTVDSQGGAVLDYGLTNTWIDLSQLGQVRTIQ